MMISTTPMNKIKLWAVLVWLLIWQAVSMWIGQEILLVSPVTVVFTLFQLAATAQFWLSIASSMLRIVGGFLLAVILGVALAGLSAASARLKEFLLSQYLKFVNISPDIFLMFYIIIHNWME